MKTICLIATILAAPSLNNTVGDDYTLQYNLKKGQSYSYSLDMDMDMSMGIDMMTGRPTEEGGMDMDMEFSIYTTVSIDEAKGEEIVMANQVDSVRMGMTMPGMPAVAFNSNRVKQGDMMDMMMMESFKAILEAPIMNTMDIYGNVKEFTFPEGFSEGTGGLGGGSNPFESMQSMYGIYPDHKVSVGETWKIETEMINNGVTLDLHNVYTLISVEKGIAKIKFTGKMVMPETDFSEIVKEEIEAEQLSEEELAELKMEMAGIITGSLSVDLKTGMPISSKNSMESTIDMDMMGQKIPMEMAGTYTMQMIK